MIKLSNTRAVRECNALFQHMDGDAFTSEPIRVRYYPLTIKEIKENQSKAAAEKAAADEKQKRYIAAAVKAGKSEEDALIDADAKIAAEDAKLPTQWLSLQLADRLHSLPDIQDQDGRPVQISPEFLETFDLVNLKAIDAAIDADLTPKLMPA